MYLERKGAVVARLLDTVGQCAPVVCIARGQAISCHCEKRLLGPRELVFRDSSERSAKLTRQSITNQQHQLQINNNQTQIMQKQSQKQNVQSKVKNKSWRMMRLMQLPL